MGTTDTTAAVGIDVSKDTLDACLLAPDGTTRQKVFPNAPAGFTALVGWADRHAADHPVHFGMEATGPYSHGLATHLHAAGRRVNPLVRRSWSLIGQTPVVGGDGGHRTKVSVIGAVSVSPVARRLTRFGSRKDPRSPTAAVTTPLPSS